MSTDQEQVQKRTPSSAKLPQVALDEAVEIANALGELGTPSTPHVIAQHMGTSYSTNSRFRTKIGAAGHFGLIKKQGDRRALTPRGEAVTGDDLDAARLARREAVMSTSYGPILHSLRGRTINDSVIKLRLQSDYSVPEGSAPTIASALIDSAAQAGLSSNGTLDAKAIEEVASALPDETDAPARGREQRPANGKATAAPKPETKRVEKQRQVKPKEEIPERPFVPGVQVVVKIDASTLGPHEIAELVRALQAPAGPAPESPESSPS